MWWGATSGAALAYERPRRAASFGHTDVNADRARLTAGRVSWRARL